MKDNLADECHLIQKRIQDIDPSVVESLDEGDFLFVASSHVLKFHREVLGQMMPLCLRNPGGGLWLKKAI